jgi:hypothetical protein
MIGELVFLYIGYKVYRAVAEDPGYQLGRAREQVWRKQQEEIGRSRENCHERSSARVEVLQARTAATNAVEGAVKDLHGASQEGLRKMSGTRTSLKQGCIKRKG